MDVHLVHTQRNGSIHTLSTKEANHVPIECPYPKRESKSHLRAKRILGRLAVDLPPSIDARGKFGTASTHHR